MNEDYIDRLAHLELECKEIELRRIQQAQRVTAGYTIAELEAMPDSALRRWDLDRKALLEACEAMMEERSENDNFMTWLHEREIQMRAAIAKARREPS